MRVLQPHKTPDFPQGTLNLVMGTKVNELYSFQYDNSKGNPWGYFKKAWSTRAVNKVASVSVDNILDTILGVSEQGATYVTPTTF